MALRFAIIKSFETILGEHHEDIIYQLDQDQILEKLVERTLTRLENIRRKKYLEPRYTADEIKAVVKLAFHDVVKDFKKVTIKIM